MTDVLVEEKNTPSPAGRQEVTLSAASFWGEASENPAVDPNAANEPASPAVTEKKDEVVNTETKPDTQTNEWYKNHGWDSEDSAKAEIEQLRKLKDSQPQEIKFENEESKHLHELYRTGKWKDAAKIIEKQERIEAVSGLEVTKETAADIIKLNLQLKYPTLKPEQVDFQFRQEYGLPKEPVMKDTDDEADFKERHDAWKEQVANIEMKTTIAATMAKPEIEAAKVKLVLPEISIASPQQKPLTQEELDAAKKYDDAFIQSVDNSIKDFNSISVKIKNEAVGLPETSIDFVIPETEKQLLANDVKAFAKEGYNANAVFAQRWVNEDNTLNAKLMAEDRYWLNNRDKILQKVANDSATKAIDSYLKGKKNINLNETNQPGTAIINKEDKTELDAVRDQFFG